MPQLIPSQLVSLYQAAHWVAVPLRLLPNGEWVETLPMFASPDSSVHALADIVQSAYNAGRIPWSEDIPIDSIDPEEMLADISAMWSISWFMEGGALVRPYALLPKETPEGEVVLWQSVQGQAVVEPPVIFSAIAKRILQIPDSPSERKG
jgi:hypothetical protein